jgi:hypothetical protein
MIHCLWQWAPTQLVTFTNQVNDIPTALFVLTILQPGDALELAQKSTSARVRFAAVLLPIRSTAVRLSPEGQTLLTRILAQVAQDANEWDGWMHAFNRFPARYPELQIPLGRALAMASEDRITSYVNSHSVDFAYDQAREAVSNCLRTFAEQADVSQRMWLWRLAFERWEAWVPIATNAGDELTQIAPCVLDYAVCGFVIEGMRPDAVDAEVKSVTASIKSIPDEWHASHVKLTTRTCRLLSRFQPFAHAAAKVGIVQRDFMPSVTYSPIDKEQDQYLAAMLSMDSIHPS